ncbi:putative protein OS=Bosea thiooxidans OX=53254 GN=SAMN05660750_03406 PE=4 SV=1 [Bosea thiooxidans]|uniref:Uncharacterized protein n=1 Tax=Bosea thiooxidans TaxID=53254 RepID=A0A1T5FNJ0_9HYPH|nr:hypothetical protein [Bosea thiooxidans]SKB97708.1 hypothetical protein SAMN05660750_03406 [Bosea thiooxidans]
MAAGAHPLAPDHLPAFITAPGETDVLMVVTAAILLMAVLGVGLLYLRLHAMPERMAHKSQKIQFEIVAVLGLLALFTHVHLFWVAGLLLALIDVPDFSGQFGRMAHALERIAGITPRRTAEGEATVTEARGADAADLPASKPEGGSHA